MPKTVSATEAKNRLGSLLGYVVEQRDDVIVESQGRPKAVLIAYAAYEEIQALREQKRRADALQELRALREQVRARNHDLTDEQAMDLADRLSHDLVDDLAAEGKARFARDRR